MSCAEAASVSGCLAAHPCCEWFEDSCRSATSLPIGAASTSGDCVPGQYSITSPFLVLLTVGPYLLLLLAMLSCHVQEYRLNRRMPLVFATTRLRAMRKRKLKRASSALQLWNTTRTMTVMGTSEPASTGTIQVEIPSGAVPAASGAASLTVQTEPPLSSELPRAAPRVTRAAQSPTLLRLSLPSPHGLSSRTSFQTFDQSLLESSHCAYEDLLGVSVAAILADLDSGVTPEVRIVPFTRGWGPWLGGSSGLSAVHRW
jgi:hypothetical protein